MTIKVWPKQHRHTEKLTIADKGEECRIDVSVGESPLAYGDIISILTHEGTVRISGNHVHELMKSVLRFSSKDMLETWIRFALLTNKAAGRKDIDMTTDYFELHNHQVEQEKEDREREYNWNQNYFNKEVA